MFRSLLTAVATGLGIASSEAHAQERGWRVLQGLDDGKPLIVRHLAELPTWLNKAAFPKLVAITWRLERSGELPTKAESKRTYEFEDRLSQAVQSAKVGLLTAVVTGNGVVEWQYYAASHEQFMSTLNAALSAQPKYPISIALQEDPTWSAYQGFAVRR